MNSNKGLGTVLLTEFTNSTAVFVDQQKLLEDIKFMLKTPKGSVLGYPEYGSNLQEMLYKQGTKATLNLISSSVYDTLTLFSGVTVLNVDAKYYPERQLISVKYDILYNVTKISNDLTINVQEV